MSRIVLLLAHSIEEYDQLRLLSHLGHDVFSIGAYTNPAHPADDKRPALPEVPYHPELACLVEGDQLAHKAQLPDALLDWAEVIIGHHYVREWIRDQWPRLRAKRVIWRTVGQSDARLEVDMRALRGDGLQVVRYSPAERRAFEPAGVFAGSDALIRFYKDPSDWGGWEGDDRRVINVTQNLVQRGEFTHSDYWLAATRGLAATALGPGSEALGGPGSLFYDEMRGWLRHARAYLYTGTQPASYTLGLIEAMMTGIPVVSIGPAWMWVPSLFEGHEIAGLWADDPAVARDILARLLDDDEYAQSVSEMQRARALDWFGPATVSAAWAAFLSCQAVEDAA